MAGAGSASEDADGIILMAQTGSVRDPAECYASINRWGFLTLKGAGAFFRKCGARCFEKAMQFCLVSTAVTQPVRGSFRSAQSFFVTDEFCSAALSKLRPYVGVIGRTISFAQLPELNREEVARANGGDGLNVMMCLKVGHTIASRLSNS